MSTEWILYIAEVIDNVREIVKMAFAFASASTLVAVVFYLFAIADKHPYLDNMKRAFYKFIWITAVITLCFALLPSKDTINAMSGVKSEACVEKKEK